MVKKYKTLLLLSLFLVGCQEQSSSDNETKKESIEEDITPTSTTEIVAAEDSIMEETIETESQTDLLEMEEPVEEIPFVKIPTGKMPEVEVIEQALEEAGLKSDFDKLNVDQLDRDLTFMKAASLPFEEFKQFELGSLDGKTCAELFEEEALKKYYVLARAYHMDKA